MLVWHNNHKHFCTRLPYFYQMTSQRMCVAQEFHSEHYVHVLDLLSTHRGWFYRCAWNTQDWLGTSRLTIEITENQGFEAFRLFWTPWLYTENIGLQTYWGCHSGWLDSNCEFRDAYCRVIQHGSLFWVDLPDFEKHWKNSPDSVVWLGQNFCMGKNGSGILVPEPLPWHWGLRNWRTAIRT